MGQTTPNIGIYVPSAGETNYDQSFLAGMVNVDQHDHSGGPNKGVPISSSGLADDSVTFEKLNANVADTTTGIGTNATPGLQNQLQILGLLKNIFQIAATNGFISKDGSNAHARTLQGTAGQIAITNPAGVAGDPTFSLPNPIVLPAAGGIVYNDTSAAQGSAPANQMGIYQQGTWTPVITTSGTQPTGLTYTTQSGRYTRVGNRIIATCVITVNAVAGVGTGQLRFSLPFSVGASGFIISALQLLNVTFDASATYYVVTAASGGSFVTPLGLGTASAGVILNAATAYGPGSTFAFTCQYEV